MPFSIDEKYISDTESELKVRFPTDFKVRMMKLNGGELSIKNFDYNLYPFFDKSDKKRIRRTCNHIGLETKNSQDYFGFPENGIAIGSDGYGNQLILLHDGNGILSEKIYLWNHETGEIEIIADSIKTI